MAKANRKFKAPPLFRLMHPRGSFRDFTYINLANFAKNKKAQLDIKIRRRGEKWALNMNEFFPAKRLLSPKERKLTKGEKLSDQIQNGFDMAKEWSDENEKGNDTIQG